MMAPAIIRALAAHDCGAYAVSPSGVEPLVCVLPGAALVRVIEALGRPTVPPVLHVMERVGATAVRFDDAGAFVNVNTPEDLTRLNAGA